LTDILGAGSPPGQAARLLQEESTLVKGEESATYSQAEGDEAWEQVMREEMGSIEENNTWKLVDSPSGHRLIGLKWVLSSRTLMTR
jgi:hypothetical protein